MTQTVSFSGSLPQIQAQVLDFLGLSMAQYQAALDAPAAAAPAAAILVPNTGAAPAPSAGPVGAPAPQAQASVELIGFPAGSVLESRGDAFGSPPTVKTPTGVVQASWVQQADGTLALEPYSPAPANNDPAAQAAGDAAVAVETAGVKAAIGS